MTPNEINAALAAFEDAAATLNGLKLALVNTGWEPRNAELAVIEMLKRAGGEA